MCRSLRSSSQSWSRRLIWHHDSRPIVHVDSWSKFNQFLVNSLFGKYLLKQLTRKKRLLLLQSVYIYEEKSSYLYNMLGLIKSLLSCVTNLLTCSCAHAVRAYMLTCQRTLHAYVFTCQHALHAYVSTCLACLRAHVSTYLACLRANVSWMLFCYCTVVHSCFFSYQAKAFNEWYDKRFRIKWFDFCLSRTLRIIFKSLIHSGRWIITGES